MTLSSDLISQFVKVTKDDNETKTGTTLYGTTAEYNGSIYVKIDGSDQLTPISTTTDVEPGERVMVMIKNHTATITGNISSPAARTDDVKDVNATVGNLAKQIAEFEIIIADQVTTEQLNAERARIDQLYSDNVVIRESITANSGDIDILQTQVLTVNESLSANSAEIENLKTTKLDASVAVLTYATIADLEAVEIDVYNLEATYGEFSSLTANRLTAIDSSITNLEAKKLDAEVASITYATISDLDVERGRITALEAGVADIDTLIFGSASGNTIQTSFANSVISQVGNAQIKSAMIESISADKITAGDIITNNVRVMSEDGSLLISDETMQISDDTRVRVQIGKDASGDYSINVWDQNGNLMFSKGGISEDAIKKPIIRDDMVSDTANISAHKLNIASLFEEINGSAHTIRSSKILLDSEGQTLDVIFTDLTTDVNGIADTVNSQGTQLSVVQGQINSKVWEQDITAAMEDIEVGGRNLFGFHKGVSIAPLLANVSSVTRNEDVYGATITVSSDYNGNILRISKLGFNVIELGKEPFTFSAVARASFDDCEVQMDICDVQNVRFTLSTTPKKISFTSYPSSFCTADDIHYNGFVDLAGTNLPIGTVIYLEKIKIERGTKATDFTVAPEDLEYVTDDLDSRTNTLTTKYSSLEQTVNGISATVATHTTELAEKADESDVIAVEERTSTLGLTVDEFKTEVASTYATKDSVDDLGAQINLNKTSIEQNTKSISLRATKTEMENAISNLDVGGRNLLLSTATAIEMPKTEEFVSYSKYKTYKFAPSIANDFKAFLLSLKTGESITLSFEVDIPRAYKDPSLSISRVGAYLPASFTRTDGTKQYWYGTHSSGATKTNRHTIDNIDVNSLVAFTADEKSYVGRYSCYLTPSKIDATLLKNFYANPDDYTVTCQGIAVEFNGFTTGGSLSNFKMEIGNKATDWTPAPEDLETRVTNTEAKIAVNSDSISSVVLRTTANENAISTLQQTSTSLTSRISVAENGIKDNNTLVLNAQNAADSARTAAANAQADIDTLEIGGRNLALNTSESVSYTMTSESGTESWNACNSYWTHGILFEAGKTYTLSFDYTFDWGSVTKPTEAVGIGVGIGSDDGKNAPGSYLADTFSMVADYWKYGDGGYDSGTFVYTLTNTKETNVYFAFRMLRSYKYQATYDVTGVTLTISNFKLEAGNRSTDWSPSPEDMATSADLTTLQTSAELVETRVTTAESLIQQLSDSISMLVTDGNGESLMVQTENGWTFSTGELQSMVDTTSTNLDNLLHEMGGVNHTIDSLQQAVDDLGILSDYVKIGSYENEPCIELGESDSDFKLLITNTRIMFMEGSGVPAYLNNQSLFINKAVIESELQQGEFIWKARSNGNLGLIWKGATN